jgi:hypothetical protein
MPVYDYQEKVPRSPKRKSETTNTTKKQKKMTKKMVGEFRWTITLSEEHIKNETINSKSE